MASCLICCFIVILFYIEESGFYEKFSHNLTLEVQIVCIVEFSNISIKMKNFNHFTTGKKRSSNPRSHYHHQGKSFLSLWSKSFLKEIHRNTQTFSFKVLRVYSFWVSRNGVVQMLFFSGTNQKHVC